MLAGISTTAHAAEKLVAPAYGYYKIVATNGHGNGQEFYYDSDASKKDLKWKDDGTVWYLDAGPYWSSYTIRLADNLERSIGVYEFYVQNDETLRVRSDNRNGVIYFYNEGGIDDPYNNLTITLFDGSEFDYSYKLNRHKSLGNDYVNLRNDDDTNNKRWKLVPVNYTKSMTRAVPGLEAGRNADLTLKWDKFRNTIKKSQVWKSAKYIEVQYSTDKALEKNVKVKKIGKGKVNKAKAKTILSKLKRKKNYYLRVRLIDGEGICSNWSKVIKCKTK